MKLLFICTMNELRSATGEEIYRNREGIDVRSAGISMSAKRKLTDEMIIWADVIFVMETRHLDFIRSKFSNLLKWKKVHNLDIPDIYQFMDPGLIELLSLKVDNYLKL